MQEIPLLNIKLAHLYSVTSGRTLLRDVEELLRLDIIKKTGNAYYANISALNKMMTRHKGLPIG